MLLWRVPKSPKTSDLIAEVERLRARNAELESLVALNASTLRFHTAMSRISTVLSGSESLEQMLMDVLDELLELFECDRAWLLYPCDPETETWGVPMERTRTEWPGAFSIGVQLPNNAESKTVFTAALAVEGPIPFDAASGNPMPAEVAQRFQIKTQMLEALHPKTDHPWLLGIHHCAEAHNYTEDDKQIFHGVCLRIADAVATLVVLRDLSSSERRFRTLVEHAPEAIVVMDAVGQFVDANANATLLFGLGAEPLLACSLVELSTRIQADGRDSAVALEEALQHATDGAAPRFPWTLIGAGGRLIHCEIALVRLDEGSPPRIRGSITDVSDRRAMEDQLLSLQKMQALDEMANGVAHDFNNQLLVVLGCADMLREQEDLHPKIVNTVDQITLAARDAAGLTSQLLAFSRRSNFELRVFDLGEMVERNAAMLERVIGPSIALTVQADSELALVRADRQQLTQVLMNLVSNARDALEDGGTIALSTSVVNVDGSSPNVPAGRYVTLSVQDNGSGMDATTRDRIFEPFFTTKDVGRGTGLGLSTAYGVVQQSGGTIRVETEPGQGSLFKVYLPWTDGIPAKAVPLAPLREDLTGTETILLVEDHAAVAQVAYNMLTSHGYQVLIVNHPHMALAFANSEKKIDLLFTDIVMPGMDGVTLSERIQALRPGVRVLYTTGNRASATGKFQSASRSQLLEKPYSLRQLLQRVRQVLDA